MTITADNFHRYEAVRQSGITNMFNVRVVQLLSGLTKHQIIYIMAHYSQLHDKYMKPSPEASGQ